MQLYLLRHADADTVATHDDDRALSDKGIAQSQRAARFCEAHDVLPELVLTSPIRRAHQTAKIVAEHLRVEMKIMRWLACGAEPVKMLQELADFSGYKSVMLVGHEPDFSHLAAHLIGAKGDALHLRKCSLSSVEVFEFAEHGGRLEFSIPPRLM
jgi:phosphohistidine phosphatase